LSLKRINLRKLLQIFDAPAPQQRTLLRADIRADARGKSAGGGDFYVPFWSDCKSHIAGTGDLTELTAARIAAHPGRTRLYNLLRDGFFDWWNGRPRWINEPYFILNDSPKAQLVVEPLDCIVKVENLLCEDR
jgi:hypothetical protein